MGERERDRDRVRMRERVREMTFLAFLLFGASSRYSKNSLPLEAPRSSKARLPHPLAIQG